MYRTEFPFMIRNSFPNEKEQFLLYKHLFSSSDYREITVRTLDAGGDKILPYCEKQLKENNPLLGTRGIRQSLFQPDIFITQINAILKASYYTKKLKILLPFISCIEEVLESKRIILNCIRNLKKQKELINENIEIGIMIEVPSTIWLLKELAEEVDFFSIGTNDMTQYILAVDRESELASSFMFSCFHPAVLRSLNYLTSQILKLEKEMTICGAIAENELLLPFLIGLGFNRFSIEPNNIPKVKKQILNISLEKSKVMVEKVLQETNINKIQSILKDFNDL